MEALWALMLITFINVVLLFFLLFKNKQLHRRFAEKLLSKKYPQVIDSILEQDRRAELKELSGDSIQINLETPGGQAAFTLKQHKDHLLIKWKARSLVYGLHNLQWIFPSDESQTGIIEKLKRDLMNYQRTIVQQQMQ